MVETLHQILLFFLLVRGIRASVSLRNVSENMLDNNVTLKRLNELGSFLLPVPQEMFERTVTKIVERYVPIHAPSELCRNHSQLLLHKFQQQELWALKMLDAGSKLGSGILDGHFQDLGNYEECINIEEPNHLFTGLHCVIDADNMVPETFAVSWKYYSQVLQAEKPQLSVMTFSVCVPSSCSDDDVVEHMDLVLAQINASTRPFIDINAASGFDRIICSSKVGPSFRIKDYMAIIIFGVILNLVLLGSIPGQKSELLACFSLKDNFKGLMDTSAPKWEVSCMNGLRVIALIGVVVAHQFYITIWTPVDRHATMVEKFDSLVPAAFELMIKGVDVFFLLGGTVLSYSFLRNMKTRDQFDIKKYCLHRYFRLTPVLFVMVLYNATLFIHSGHGPIWTKTVHFREDSCNQYWWTSLLHISTLVNPGGQMCLSESWYVACDFQLHVLAPLLLLPLHRKPRVGILLIALCLIASTVGSGVVALFKEIETGAFTYLVFRDRKTDVFWYVREYMAFYFKASPFLIGIILGLYLFKFREEESRKQLTKRDLLLGWTVSASILVGLVVCTILVVDPSHRFSPWADPLYFALSKPLLSLAVSWIILVCDLGYGGKLNSFLSHGAFRPLSRLSYSVYLIVVTVQLTQKGVMQVAPAFSFLDEVFLGTGAMELAFLLAVVMYLAVEIPFMRVASKFLKGKEKVVAAKKDSA